MKTKRKSIVLTIALCLLIALTSLLTVPFSRAKAEVKVADLVTEGTAYDPAEKTVTEGTITYTDAWNVTSSFLESGQGPYSGAVLTANPGSSTFNLGTYDFSTADASKALIKFLPWSNHTATNGTDPYDNFLIIFSSGEKSFSVKSYTRSNGELGMGVKGESQSKHIGWNSFNGTQTAIAQGGDIISNYIQLGLDGFYGGVRAYGTEATITASTYINNKRGLSVPGIYINPTADDFWVYTNVACIGSTYNSTSWFATSGHVLFGESGSQYARYKMRNLKADGVASDSAWTPFTEDELKTVTVTVKLEGLKEQSKFLVTELNGTPVTSVAGMTVTNDSVYDGIALNVEDGVARTITEENKTLAVANKLMLADNDVYAPLAKIALFPKEYGSEGATTVNVNNYTRATDAGFGMYSNGKFWKTATSEADFNNAVATNDAKNNRDIDALYLNFTTESGKYASVKLTFRPVDDSGSMTTSYQARVNEADQYKSLFVTGGRYDTSKATAPASAIRFDGFVASGDEYDEKGVQMNTKGAKQDPVYTVYYNAEDNTLYADSGRIRHNTQTNFGTAGDLLYRWKIIDFDDFGFAGFGNELVTMTVTADLRDKDGDADLTDETAHIMLMNVDGQDLENDGTDVTATPLETTYAYGYESAVIAKLGDSHAGQTVKMHTFLTGEVEYDNSQYDMEVTGPDGEVTVDGGAFVMDKMGDYEVTIKIDSEVVAEYVVTAIHTLTANAGANGAIKVNGEAPSEYDATGSYEITVEPNAHYEVDTFTVGGVDKKAELVDGAYAYDGTGASEDVAIEVTFKAITYTITYDLAGGAVTHTNPVSYSVETADITLVAPTSAEKTGYTFDGWNVTQIETSTGGNVTVTAKWTEVVEEPTSDEKGCGKEAVGLLAIVLSALAVVFVSKRK